MTERYTRVAVALHWAIAAAMVVNLGLGAWMHEAIDEPVTQARAIAAFQLHKSLGLTVLVLSLVRLGWRLAHRPPPLPLGMRRLERVAAAATHWSFYALMICMPLSGWLYASTQWRGDAPLGVPTLWFSLFEVPHLFGLDTASSATRGTVAGIAIETHELLAWSTVFLLVLHVGAALKHQFVNRDGVLARMRPSLAAVIAILVATLGFGYALVVGGARPAAAPEATLVEDTGSSGYRVDASASSLAFSGTHAAVEFRGRFSRWSTDIRFDPLSPATGRITATIETASASDGVALHDSSLRQPEWFDVERYPTANFESTAIRDLGGNRFEVEGVLTIKDRRIRVPALSLFIDGERIVIEGEFSVSRAEADLGMASDPGGTYVSNDIAVQVRVEAERLRATAAGAFALRIYAQHR